jgi:hypothetical protein
MPSERPIRIEPEARVVNRVRLTSKSRDKKLSILCDLGVRLCWVATNSRLPDDERITYDFRGLR